MSGASFAVPSVTASHSGSSVALTTPARRPSGPITARETLKAQTPSCVRYGGETNSRDPGSGSARTAWKNGRL
jgi:hypothetical protein